MKSLLLSRTDYSVVNATGHTSCFDTLLPSNRASFIQAASSVERGGEGGESLVECNVCKTVLAFQFLQHCSTHLPQINNPSAIQFGQKKKKN